MTSWTGVTADHPFGLHTLPYGVFTAAAQPQPHVGVAVGDAILDLTVAGTALWPERAALFRGGSLDALLAAGRPTWTALRTALTRWLSGEQYAEIL
ncbi:MAG: fumarylacetoacetase, partial [Pseudonocardiaceae bacterium]